MAVSSSCGERPGGALQSSLRQQPGVSPAPESAPVKSGWLAETPKRAAGSGTAPNRPRRERHNNARAGTHGLDQRRRHRCRCQRRSPALRCARCCHHLAALPLDEQRIAVENALSCRSAWMWTRLAIVAMHHHDTQPGGVRCIPISEMKMMHCILAGQVVTYIRKAQEASRKLGYSTERGERNFRKATDVHTCHPGARLWADGCGQMGGQGQCVVQ